MGFMFPQLDLSVNIF